MKKSTTTETDEMRPYYDFSGGVRGKYAAEYAKGTNVVVIEPELAKLFPDSEAVNEALRTLVRAASKPSRASRQSRTKQRVTTR